MSSDTHPRDGSEEARSAQRSERVWVFVDSHGGPDLVEYTVRVSEKEYLLGMHYDKGMALARENDFTAIKAFGQMDPAGKLLTKTYVKPRLSGRGLKVPSHPKWVDGPIEMARARL